MPHNLNKEAIETVVIYSTLWWVWGFIHYLDQVRKGQRFRFGMFVINIFTAIWIGSLVWPIIPDNWGNIRYSAVSMSWFLSYPILSFVENKWIYLLLKKLWVKK